MRKFLLIFLLTAGAVTNLPAQTAWYYYPEPYTTAAEAIFNSPKPGKAKVNFKFFGIGSGGLLTLELVSIKQLKYLPDLDSVINVAKASLMHISDSLKEDGINRRIDMMLGNNIATQLRITSYSHRAPTFVIKDNELNILKTEQDTLRIKITVPLGRTARYTDMNGSKSMREQYAPVFITIVINNFDEIQRLSSNVMQRCLELLKKDISPEYIEKASSLARYSAFYNLSSSRRVSPNKSKYIKYGGYRNELVPNIYGSLQFVRGNVVPSMAAGIRFSGYRSSLNINRFYLMWEPYFFFRRDAANKLITERNDFVTFRYIQNDEDERKKASFEYVGNFSIGYLTYKKGDWFEKNTFKVGLPGVRSGWLQLEPEFYFNDFLKNFSPTLKLTLHYE